MPVHHFIFHYHLYFLLLLCMKPFFKKNNNKTGFKIRVLIALGIFFIVLCTPIVIVTNIFESPINNMIIRFVQIEFLVFLCVYAYIKFRNRNNLDESESIIKKWGLLRFLFRMFFIAVTVLLIVSIIYESSLLGNIFDPYYFVLLIAYLLEVFITHLYQSVQLKNEQTQAELVHLRSQLNPHFFLIRSITYMH